MIHGDIGLENTWAFFNLIFLQNLSVFIVAFYSIKISKLGINDKDKPEFLPIKQNDVKKALAFRTFWILLHVLTCLLIIAGNGRVMGWW